MMRPLVRLVACALSVAGLFGAGTAAASQNFPGQLRKALDGTCAPTCLLCHTSMDGGVATVRFDRPTTLKYRAIAAGYDDPAKVAAARASLGETTDSDEDGIPDLKELTDGSDPWEYGGGSKCPPEYGCGATIAEHPPTQAGHTPEYVVAAVAAVALLQRRKRKNS